MYSIETVTESKVHVEHGERAWANESTGAERRSWRGWSLAYEHECLRANLADCKAHLEGQPAPSTLQPSSVHVLMKLMNVLSISTTNVSQSCIAATK